MRLPYSTLHVMRKHYKPNHYQLVDHKVETRRLAS